MPPCGVRWATDFLAKLESEMCDIKCRVAVDYFEEWDSEMLSDCNIRRDKKYNIFRRVLLFIRKKNGNKYRVQLNEEIKRKLENTSEFTIFSNNCLGGVFYHDAGRKFTSPLINTAMDGEDFLKFVSNPQHYLNCDMNFITWPGRDFPIAKIDDIEVNFVHYKTKEECIEKWNKRKERIVWDNIFIVTTNQDGMCHDSCMKKFDELAYKNKIMFVSKDYPQYEWAIMIPQFKNRFQCRITTAFADMKGHRYYETVFDIAKWIQEKSRNKEKKTNEGNSN